MRVEQRADGTIARVLDPVEVNLLVRFLRLNHDLLQQRQELEEELSAVKTRLGLAEAELFSFRQLVGPQLGQFLTAADLLRGNSQLQADATNENRSVLVATASGIIGYTQGIRLLPGSWRTAVFVRGPVRLVVRSGNSIIATSDDNGTAWRIVSLAFALQKSDVQVQVEALGPAALDYLTLQLEVN